MSCELFKLFIHRRFLAQVDKAGLLLLPFTDKETQVQNDSGTCRASQRQPVAEPCCKPGVLVPGATLLARTLHSPSIEQLTSVSPSIKSLRICDLKV